MHEGIDSYNDYRLYCFDLDDTLVDTFRHVAKVLYPRLGKRSGLRIPGPDEIRRHWGGALEDSLRALFPEVADSSSLLGDLHELHLEDPVPAVRDAKQILDILRRHGRYLALFTAGDPEIARYTVTSSLGLKEENLGSLYLLSQRNETKESPGILDRIRQEVSDKTGTLVPPEQILVVGDDPRDGELARRGYADFLGLTSGPFGMQDFKDAGFPERCLSPDLATGLSAPADHGVVAIIRDREGRYLLVKEGRADNPYVGAWSGPHGRCQPSDVLEEESVVRESREECGIEVRVLKRLYTRAADTKVRTVSFWLAEFLEESPAPRVACEREVADVRWFATDEILSGEIPLYPGTLDFFQCFGERLEKT